MKKGFIKTLTIVFLVCVLALTAVACDKTVEVSITTPTTATINTDVSLTAVVKLDGEITDKYEIEWSATNKSGTTGFTINGNVLRATGEGTVSVIAKAIGAKGSDTIDIVFTAPAQTNQQKADAFKAAHSTVLGKTVETIAVTDKAAVTAALNAYNALEAGVKDLLTTQKTLLDSLQTKIAQLEAGAAITGVTVSGTAELVFGATATYTAVVGGEGVAQTVTWSTSDETVATISEAGVLTILKAGDIKVIATSTVDPTKKGEFNVKINKAQTTITAEATQSADYTGSALAVAATVAQAGVSASIKYYSDSNHTTEVQPINAGVYYAVVSVASDAYTATPVNVTFTIKKVNVTIVAEAQQTVLFSQVGSFKVAASVVEIPTLSLKFEIFTDKALTQSVASINARGAFYVKVSLVDANYNVTPVVVSVYVYDGTDVVVAEAYAVRFTVLLNKGLSDLGDFADEFDALILDATALNPAAFSLLEMSQDFVVARAIRNYSAIVDMETWTKTEWLEFGNEEYAEYQIFKASIINLTEDELEAFDAQMAIMDASAHSGLAPDKTYFDDVVLEAIEATDVDVTFIMQASIQTVIAKYNALAKYIVDNTDLTLKDNKTDVLAVKKVYDDLITAANATGTETEKADKVAEVNRLWSLFDGSHAVLDGYVADIVALEKALFATLISDTQTASGLDLDLDNDGAAALSAIDKDNYAAYLADIDTLIAAYGTYSKPTQEETATKEDKGNLDALKNKALAMEFVAKHYNILRIETQYIRESDEATVRAALTAYNALDEDVKPYAKVETEDCLTIIEGLLKAIATIRIDGDSKKGFVVAASLTDKQTKTIDINTLANNTFVLSATGIEGVNVTKATYAWSSSNIAIATVTGTTEKGSITIIGIGTVTITLKITSFDGTVITLTHALTVKKAANTEKVSDDFEGEDEYEYSFVEATSKLTVVVPATITEAVEFVVTDSTETSAPTTGWSASNVLTIEDIKDFKVWIRYAATALVDASTAEVIAGCDPDLVQELILETLIGQLPEINNVTLAAHEELIERIAELSAAVSNFYDIWDIENVDISEYTIKLVELRVAAFKSAHSAILAKTVENIALSNKAALDTALKAYDKLSTQEKGFLQDEELKLNDLLNKLVELEIAKFRADFAAIIELEEEDAVEADRARIESAVNTVNNLFEAARNMLATERMHMSDLLNFLDAEQIVVFQEKYEELLAADVTLDIEADLFDALAEYSKLPLATQTGLSSERNLLIDLIGQVGNLRIAANFRSDYAAILAKTDETVAIADKAAVVAAIKAYNELDAMKSEFVGDLSDENALLVELRDKIVALEIALFESTYEYLNELQESGEENVVKESNRAALVAAIAAYDNADQEVQNSISKSRFETLIEALDQKIADAFTTTHATILAANAAQVTADNISTFESPAKAALNAYNALNTEVKALLDSEIADVEGIIDAVNVFKNAASFRATHLTILGRTLDNVRLDDRKRLTDARDAYNKLSDEVKLKLTEEGTKLTALEDVFEEIDSFYAVNNNYVASTFYSMADIMLTHETIVGGAITAIESLTGDADKVAAARLLAPVLAELEKRADAITKANAFKTAYTDIIDLVDDIDDVTLADKADIEAALAAYNKTGTGATLTEDSRALLVREGIKGYLDAALALITTVENFVDTHDILNKIENEIVVGDKAKVNAAKTAFDALVKAKNENAVKLIEDAFSSPSITEDLFGFLRAIALLEAGSSSTVIITRITIMNADLKTEFAKDKVITIMPSFDGANVNNFVPTSVNWTSSNVAVATITRDAGGNGLLKVVGAGKTDITVTYGSGANAATFTFEYEVEKANTAAPLIFDFDLAYNEETHTITVVPKNASVTYEYNITGNDEDWTSINVFEAEEDQPAVGNTPATYHDMPIFVRVKDSANFEESNVAYILAEIDWMVLANRIATLPGKIADIAHTHKDAIETIATLYTSLGADSAASLEEARFTLLWPYAIATDLGDAITAVENQLAAAIFKHANRVILSRTESTLRETDFATVTAVRAAYEDLDDGVKALLSDVDTLIGRLEAVSASADTYLQITAVTNARAILAGSKTLATTDRDDVETAIEEYYDLDENLQAIFKTTVGNFYNLLRQIAVLEADGTTDLKVAYTEISGSSEIAYSTTAKYNYTARIFGANVSGLTVTWSISDASTDVITVVPTTGVVSIKSLANLTGATKTLVATFVKGSGASAVTVATAELEITVVKAAAPKAPSISGLNYTQASKSITTLVSTSNTWEYSADGKTGWTDFGAGISVTAVKASSLSYYFRLKATDLVNASESTLVTITDAMLVNILANNLSKPEANDLLTQGTANDAAIIASLLALRTKLGNSWTSAITTAVSSASITVGGGTPVATSTTVPTFAALMDIYEAAAFLTKHAVILAVESNTVAEANRKAIVSALADYAALSGTAPTSVANSGSGVKKITEIVAAKAALDTLLETIDEELADTFIAAHMTSALEDKTADTGSGTSVAETDREDIELARIAYLALSEGAKALVNAVDQAAPAGTLGHWDHLNALLVVLDAAVFATMTP